MKKFSDYLKENEVVNEAKDGLVVIKDASNHLVRAINVLLETDDFDSSFIRNEIQKVIFKLKQIRNGKSKDGSDVN
jgi:hypothetical protein